MFCKESVHSRWIVHEVEGSKGTVTAGAINGSKAGIHGFESYEGMDGEVGDDDARIRRGVGAFLRYRDASGRFGEDFEINDRIRILAGAERSGDL